MKKTESLITLHLSKDLNKDRIIDMLLILVYRYDLRSENVEHKMPIEIFTIRVLFSHRYQIIHSSDSVLEYSKTVGCVCLVHHVSKTNNLSHTLLFDVLIFGTCNYSVDIRYLSFDSICVLSESVIRSFTISCLVPSSRSTYDNTLVGNKTYK